MHPDVATAETALSLEEIRRHLSAHVVGRRLCLYEAVPSTNATLRALARAGAADGTTVLAESQTAGRGRGGKAWFSPPGVNLYASVLCRPGITPAAAPVFSFVASLALADAIRELGLHPAIKWPNDVLVRHRKVAGILTELSIAGERLEHVILGVGVNVNVERDLLRAALGPAAQHAISLREALGRPVERNAFAGTFLTYLDEWLITYREQGPERILRAWRDLDIVTGRRVGVRDDTATLEGRARGVAADGHLEIEDAHGAVHRIVAGEVRLLE
jgi:BirA family biotin operon repressor/biotin-[acetyl-CoA-carboxylase] ligase